MKDDVIVLYPSPGIGHLISMVELGKLILTHHPSFSIIIFITTAPYNTGSTAPYINHVTQTTPSILFHHLPTISLPHHLISSSNHQETLTFKLLHLNNPNVHQALQTISQSATVRSFIIDFFCYSSFDVAYNSNNIPTYYFFTSNAAVLSVFLYFPTIHKNTTKSFKDLETNLEIPGFPSIPATDMTKPMLDRTDEAYQYFLDCTTTFPKSQGIMVNSFESLEPRAIKAISDGLCVPDSPTPPVYYIGPLIASSHYNHDKSSGDESECLNWLDSQPSQSVVFLCFGSLGLFTAAQLKEIAFGLERSGQRFLWVVRSPPTEDKTKRFLAPQNPDLHTLLPEGFLDRTREKGLVVKSWAPQVAVLSHRSVGGFVTHCGWNSVLEAVCAGVPMVAWPLYAEQRLNKAVLVEDMKLALPMEESEAGFVSAAEVEKRVTELMSESDEGRAVRNRIMVMSESAKAAMSEGGSSRRALVELTESWKRGNLIGHAQSSRSSNLNN